MVRDAPVFGKMGGLVLRPAKKTPVLPASTGPVFAGVE